MLALLGERKSYMNGNPSIIRFLLTRLVIYLAAVLVTYLLASIIATQSVVSSLAGMGVAVGLSDRMIMTSQDIVGMASMFLPMVAFALLIAFLVAALICRWVKQWQLPLYVLAGAVAVICIHVALNLAFDLTPVAAARTNAGLLLQGLAGAVGGFTYISLTRKT